MKSWLALTTVALFATPVCAMDVTNLDSVPHRVLLQASGERLIQTIEPGDKGYFAGQTNGFITLLDAENPQPSQGTLHADGILSGIVGAARTERIPADAMDSFVIWPDGTIRVQQHRRGGGRNR